MTHSYAVAVAGVEIQSSIPVEVVAEGERFVDCCAAVVAATVGIAAAGSWIAETLEYFESIDGQLDDGFGDFLADL